VARDMLFDVIRQKLRAVKNGGLAILILAVTDGKRAQGTFDQADR
jgi:hypothetical protein